MSRYPRSCNRDGCDRPAIEGSRLRLCLPHLTGHPSVTAPPRLTVVPTPIERGRELRDQGAQAALDAQPDDWKTRADSRLRQLAATGQPFTADDLVRQVGVPASPNALGGLFIGASKRGLIRKTGQYVQGTRTEQHARAVPVWIGT